MEIDSVTLHASTKFDGTLYRETLRLTTQPQLKPFHDIALNMIPPDSRLTPKVHALLILLGNDTNIRKSVETNANTMQTVLRRLSGNCVVRMTVMVSEDETTGTITEKTLIEGNVKSENSTKQVGIIKADQISDWIHKLKPENDDTLLIYYSGHGMINEDGMHILQFDPNVTTDSVPRAHLRKLLQQKQCRLKMLITDTCSRHDDISPQTPESAAVKVVHKKQQYTEDLFLKHHGILDITAASPGQDAWGNSKVGGYFTASLNESLTASTDTNKDKFLSWEEVFSATYAKTQEHFQGIPFGENNRHGAEQTTQKPFSHSLPTPIKQ